MNCRRPPRVARNASETRFAHEVRPAQHGGNLGHAGKRKAEGANDCWLRCALYLSKVVKCGNTIRSRVHGGMSAARAISTRLSPSKYRFANC
jgi:hypothetical protein